jgi:hypothetical protein
LRTATELLVSQAMSIRERVNELLDRSSMKRIDPDLGSAVWIGPTVAWDDLDIEGSRVQSRVLEDYRRFLETVTVLLRGQPADVLREVNESDTAVREILEQSQLSWLNSVDEARERPSLRLTRYALCWNVYTIPAKAWTSTCQTQTRCCTTLTLSAGSSPTREASSWSWHRPSWSNSTSSKSTTGTQRSAIRPRG